MTNFLQMVRTPRWASLWPKTNYNKINKLDHLDGPASHKEDNCSTPSFILMGLSFIQYHSISYFFHTLKDYDFKRKKIIEGLLGTRFFRFLCVQDKTGPLPKTGICAFFPFQMVTSLLIGNCVLE